MKRREAIGTGILKCPSMRAALLARRRHREAVEMQEVKWKILI